MPHNLFVTVGISLLREDMYEKTMKVGFTHLGRFPTLERLYKEMSEMDEEARRNPSRNYATKLDGRNLVNANDALAKAIVRLWTDPELLIDLKDQRRYSGAELASLMALHQRPGRTLDSEDTVWLLASDTPSGLFTARVIQRVLRTGEIGLPAFQTIRIKQITGLQPYNEVAFVEQGLPEAASLLLTERSRPAQLIGSGGYKGLLPYLGPLAMKLGIPLFYLYEDSEALLEIAPLPLTVEFEVMKRYRKLFMTLNPLQARHVSLAKRKTFPADEFWTKLKQIAAADYAEDREEILTYKLLDTLEINGKFHVRLSATGVLAAALDAVDNPAEPPTDQSPVAWSS